MNIKHESRRKTPWDSVSEVQLTPTQEFLKSKYQKHYEQHHPQITDTEEYKLINSFVPADCPFCHSEKFFRQGHTRNNVQRYRCSECKATFLPTTGTIFDGHKISISEWMEYCLNLFHYVSINADSWNNKNAFQTSKYWLLKIFAILEDYQKDIVLSGSVWLDETYYKVSKQDVDVKDDGKEYRGLSRNQICIGVAYDKDNVLCMYEGQGKTSQKKTWETFGCHIQKGSILVHDDEQAHKKLVNNLSLTSKVHLAKELKGIADESNPLNPVNRIHMLLQEFLHSHNSFNRDEINGYLNLFSFIINPPHDYLEKVEELVNLAFQKRKLLRYRDQFGLNKRDGN